MSRIRNPAFRMRDVRQLWLGYDDTGKQPAVRMLVYPLVPPAGTAAYAHEVKVEPMDSLAAALRRLADRLDPTGTER